MVWCPEQLLQCMLAHIHYMPDHWRGSANKNETRDEVAQLFQYKAVRHGRFLKTTTHLSELILKILLIFFFNFPQSGVHFGGVAKPYRYTIYSHLSAEE